jgi:hypothetical protein
MAYMAKIEPQDSQLALSPRAPATPEFSGLEWSVIRLARIDRLWTIRSVGRFRNLWNWLIGRGNPQLANPRLEALRRMAVLTWHFGFTVPGEDVSDFLSAGFTPDQYELMAGSINSALSPRRRIPA